MAKNLITAQADFLEALQAVWGVEYKDRTRMDKVREATTARINSSAYWHPDRLSPHASSLIPADNVAKMLFVCGAHYSELSGLHRGNPRPYFEKVEVLIAEALVGHELEPA